MQQPVLSSVLYLYGDHYRSRLGEVLIICLTLNLTEIWPVAVVKTAETNYVSAATSLISNGSLQPAVCCSMLFMMSLCAGPTVVLDQLYDPQQQCAVPSAPTKSTLVFPLENAYLLFDGTLAHGVLGSYHAGKRATLLVNWWCKKPQVQHTCLETRLLLLCLGYDAWRSVHQWRGHGVRPSKAYSKFVVGKTCTEYMRQMDCTSIYFCTKLA